MIPFFFVKNVSGPSKLLYLLPLKEASWVTFRSNRVHDYLYVAQLASFSGGNYSFMHIF